MKNTLDSQIKIAVIGGGTGTSVVLSELKKSPQAQLTAIVVVSDSGGSTGRLRDEFGFLAVGDLRQCLAALSDGDYEEEIRDLLLYRFNKGNGLKGHNLGNLILTALEDLTKSPGKSIELASKIFRIKGQVYPITEENVDLVIQYGDGTLKVGEDNLDNPSFGGKKIKEISFSSPAKIYSKAALAIEESDVIVFGPGDLYGSLFPNTKAQGFKQSLAKNKGTFVYIVNLMTHYSQTHEMTAKDHVNEVIHYCGRKPDVVIINNQPIPKQLQQVYEKGHEFPVIDDLTDTDGYKIIRTNCISHLIISQESSDSVPRSLLRHDGEKLAQIILSL